MAYIGLTSSAGIAELQTAVTALQTGKADVTNQGIAKSWVTCNCTKDTTGAVSTANTNRLINSQLGVTSVLRNALGDFTVTLSSSMSDANFNFIASGFRSTNETIVARISGTPTSNTLRVLTFDRTGATVDPEYLNIAIFR